MLHKTLTCLATLLLATPCPARGATAVPFDEETLDQIDSLNRAISEHYEGAAELIHRDRGPTGPDQVPYLKHRGGARQCRT